MKAQQLPSGKWRVQVQKDGKRYSFTSDKKTDAKSQARAFRDNKADITDKPLGVAISEYIDMKRNVLSPSTILGYESIRKYSLQNLMDLPIRDLTSEVVQREVNLMAADHSPKSVRNAYGLISATLKVYAPALSVAVTLPKKRRVEYDIPSTSEVALMLSEAHTEELKTAIMLAAFCGLRRSEIIALHSDDIHGKMIHVKHAAVYSPNGEMVIKDPKTYQSDRYVTMPDIVYDHVQGMSGRICPVGLSTLTRQFVTLRRHLGLSCRFHDLRHYFASFQHAIGVPDQYIMQSGGWKSDSVLKSVYRNTLEDMQKKNDDLINNFINQSI